MTSEPSKGNKQPPAFGEESVKRWREIKVPLWEGVGRRQGSGRGRGGGETK